MTASAATSTAIGQDPGEVILRLDAVHTYYGHIHALQGIDLEVHRGEIVTLIGANGAGKTTTLKTISGLLHPRSGTVEFEGKDVSTRAPHDLVRDGIGHGDLRHAHPGQHAPERSLHHRRDDDARLRRLRGIRR